MFPFFPYKKLIFVMVLIFSLIIFTDQVVQLFLWIIQMGLRFIQPFLLAMLFAYFLFPIVNWLKGKGVKKSVSIGLIVLWLSSFCFISIYFLYPYMVEQLDMLMQQLPNVFQKIDNLLASINKQAYGFPPFMQEQIDEALLAAEEIVEERLARWLKRLTNIFHLLMVATVTPIILFYILKDGERWKQVLISKLADRHQEKLIQMMRIIHLHNGKYLYGQVIVVFIVSSLLFIVYYFLRIPYAILFAIFGGFMNIIPYIGPIIGAIPVVISAAFISWHTAFMVVSLTIIIQIIEGTVISPYIIGKTVQLHPLTVIAALLLGGEIAGVIGMILIIPVFSIMKACYYMNRSAD